jgi:hypothetical protein
MANLLDAMRKGLQEPGAATGGQTQQAQQLITARQTGRAAATPTGPQRAAEGERIQDVIAAREQESVQRGALGQLEQLKQQSDDVAQQAVMQQAQDAEALKAVQDAAQNRAADFLQQIQQESGRMDEKERANSMELAAFQLRLGNEQYLNDLQQAGRQNRLDDANEFKIELQKQIFADHQDLLKDELAFKEMMALDDADFSRLMSQINIDHAMSMANTAAKQANTRAIFEGIPSLMGMAFQEYGKEGEKTSMWEQLTGGE